MVIRLVGAELTQRGIFTVKEKDSLYIEEFFKDPESFIVVIVEKQSIP